MKIALACDHGGYDLKMAIIAHLEKRGIEVMDLGTNNATDSVNYPEYGEAAALKVANGEADCGIEDFKMKIALACDHGGYDLKMTIIAHLEKRGIEVMDLGTNNATDSVNYPEYGEAAALKVANGEADCGILVCGTGIGISLAANKVPGIRCAVVSDTKMCCCK